MKTLLLSAVSISLLSLAGCQSASTADSSRRFEPMGANGRYEVELPPSGAPAGGERPYALTGSQAAPMAYPNMGYQSR